MPIAVSNSSPLVNLAAVGHFDLLRSEFDHLIIPPAVWEEVVTQGNSRAGAAELELARKAGWIKIVKPNSTGLIRILRREIDWGEAEAITLTMELSPDFIILDEQRARSVATRLGAPVIGTLGLLLRFQKKGHVSSMSLMLDKLQNEVGFRISEDLKRQILSEDK